MVIKHKKYLLWILAVIVTLSTAYFQRITGPTYPEIVKINLNSAEYKLKLIKSYGSEKYEDAEIKLAIPDAGITGKVYYREFPSNVKWETINLERENRVIDSYIMNRLFKQYDEDVLITELPYQPPAGKLEYYIELLDGNKSVFIAKDEPIVIRFRGKVPVYVLVPHAILMFAAMLISTLAGFFAGWEIPRYWFYSKIAFFLILAGGMILGPLVQYFAFNEFWTGVPVGWDLTDNKTLVAFIGWAIAFLGNLRKERPRLTIIAAIVLFLIFLIPHSTFGSELDRETGEIVNGYIQMIRLL